MPAAGFFCARLGDFACRSQTSLRPSKHSCFLSCGELTDPPLFCPQRVTLEEELKALMGPVRKNTTDLEEGLQELADLSQMVQSEMSSQRDTLDGLLETMQKTISIEVRASRHCRPHHQRSR